MDNCFNKISQAELNAIDAYIDLYAPSSDAAVTGARASVEHILREWTAQKQTLFHMFGNELILERSFEIAKDADTICHEFEEEPYSSPVKSFRSAICSAIWDCQESWIDGCRYDLVDCLTYKDMASNIYSGAELTITFPCDGKPYKIVKGMKMSKLLVRLAKTFHYENLYEAYRIRCSQLTNDKYLRGTLCLSIHPLDYMTMSDNKYDWSSCMSWKNEGEYRQGTVEMMNSPKVVVGYLKGDHESDMRIGDLYWNSKKWRSLFIITPEAISSVKGYPYQNVALNDMCVNWLAKLAKANLGLDYDETIYPMDNYTLTKNDGIHYCLHYETNAMYNDFGTLPNCYAHRVRINPTYLNDNHIVYINYSGRNECMWCGSFGDVYESLLVCEYCQQYSECEECGYHTSEDNMYELDGRMMCEECYYEYMAEDSFTRDPHDSRNMKELYIIFPDQEPESYYWSNPIYSYDLYSWNGKIPHAEDYFVNGMDSVKQLRDLPHTYNTGCYIAFEDIKPECYTKLFDRWVKTKEDVKRFIGFNN